MNFSAFFSGIFVWFLPVIFVGLTTDAWAGDFQIRLKFPKEKAAILISPDGLCSWEKQGSLVLDLAQDCQIRSYRGTMTIDIANVEVGEYQLEIVAPESNTDDYNVSVYIDSDIQLIAETPAKSYTHEDMNAPIEFAVRLLGTDQIKQVTSVTITESDDKTVTSALEMKPLGPNNAAWYVAQVQPLKTCSNHTFTAKATGVLNNGNAFTRTHPFYIDVGGESCKEPVRKEYATVDVRFFVGAAGLDDKRFAEPSNQRKVIQERMIPKTCPCPQAALGPDRYLSGGDVPFTGGATSLEALALVPCTFRGEARLSEDQLRRMLPRT